MNWETKTAHITHADGNVFIDLGFKPEEATALEAESREIISRKQATREALNNEADGQDKYKDNPTENPS